MCFHQRVAVCAVALESVITISLVLQAATAVGQTATDTEPVPVIHVTDLFRPHNDPDDHWDLACNYALACQGRVDLRAVLIDYPQLQRGNDPDVLAVAQMNYLTGKAVPVLVGSPRWHDPTEPTTPDRERDLRGVRAMLDVMRQSPSPLVIHVLGSCRDVALAGRQEPELFARKCRAIYLNAGSGTPDAALAERLEWNVHLDPAAYSAIFELPCPVYWMPCFEVVRAKPGELFRVAEYGTFYRFRQGDVLPQLSDGVQRYLAYMFAHGRSITQLPESPQRPDWLQWLEQAPDPERVQRMMDMDRNMWCTAGFLHAVGQTVTRDGEIVSLQDARDPLFTFDAVQVTCAPSGVTRWQFAAGKTNRYLFHVRDVERYQGAMTAALKSLLRDLP